ncbi:MAG: FG-GAP-like repeat-containing protein [Calditrichia bacterium]
MKRYIFFPLLICWCLSVTLLHAQHPALQEIYSLQGWTNGVFLGNGLINPGDLNGDGYNEFISYSRNTSKVLFYWGAFPVDTIPDLTFFEMGPQFPKSLRDVAVANIDHDSLMEMIVPFTGSQDYETFIYKLGIGQDSLADFILDGGGENVCIGDLNGDGYDDIILADPDSVWLSRGRVRIYLGSANFDTTADYVIIGDSSRTSLGFAITTGDLNGDNYDDLIVWGINYNINVSFDYIRIYNGSTNFDTTYDFQLNDPSINPANLGFTLPALSTFDYNQDGYDDLFIGGIFIYNGSTNFDTIPEHHLIWPDSSFNAYGGLTFNYLFNSGDINKDGYQDLAIGMPFMFGGKGLVHIRMGSPYGLDQDYIIVEPNRGSGFGWSVVPIGDIDQNGVSDILIGEPRNGLYDQGKLHFYSGDSTLSPVVGIRGTSLPKPLAFVLKQNYPNPFNNETVIQYQLFKKLHVRLTIYNIQGQVIRNLIDESQSAGRHHAYWDGKDLNNRDVASGIYFYQLKLIDLTTSQTFQRTKKLIYLK